MQDLLLLKLDDVKKRFYKLPEHLTDPPHLSAQRTRNFPKPLFPSGRSIQRGRPDPLKKQRQRRRRTVGKWR